jgi:Tol biopolymer transport system component
MGLAPGTRLGPYEVTAKLGEGGMGEVFRARDTRLGRAVALKVLPEPFAGDPARLARFEREARLLASLNHPHIAQIYGIEGAAPSGERRDDVQAIVMELVEGPTLAERIANGPIPLKEALSIAWQIVDALDAAHAAGIVHRDLKPANIKVTADGTVKVLDFGIARSIESDDSVADRTRTASGTGPGMFLGSPAYMAPEHIEGRTVDKRADIWAFGVVLYEMLAGARLFGSDTTGAALRAVLTKEPDWTAVAPEALPLLRRCLERDPKRRLRDIADARFLIAELVPATPRSPSQKLPWIVAGFAGAAAVAMVAWVALRPSVPVADRGLMRLDVDLGTPRVSSAFSAVAISPRGTHIAFPTRGQDGRSIVALRSLDGGPVTPLAGTDGGDMPVFSPDGQWLGFFAAGKLKKVSIHGGMPVDLCDAAIARGASWGDDGTIVAALSNNTGLSRIPAAGGQPQPLTKTTPADPTHRWPQMLPGSKAVLFTGSAPSINIYEDAAIEVLSLTTGERKTLWRGGYFGRFLPTSAGRGHLAFVSRGALFTVPFDAERLQIDGTPARVVEDLGSDAGAGSGRFDFSHNGTLVYARGIGTLSWSVDWLDRDGKTQPLIAQQGLYFSPRFSPDGQRLAVGIDHGKGTDIYVHDQQNDRLTRLTFSGGMNADPIWSPRGTHLAYRHRTEQGEAISWVRADGRGEPQRLLDKGTVLSNLSAGAFSPDGRHLLYSQTDPKQRGDVWVLPLDHADPDRPKPGAPRPLLQTAFEEARPAFSPDGHWVSYHSNESGTFEIYVRSFDELLSGRGGRWQVSTGGGNMPIWSRSSRELFYVTLDGRIMRVEYRVEGGSFLAGKPVEWSTVRLFSPGFTPLDLAPDGKRFAMVLRPPETAPPSTIRLTFLLDFFDELRRRERQGR